MQKLEELMDALRDLGPEGLQALQEVAKLEELKAQKDGAVPEHLQGTPRDTAVQRLAGHFLRLLRQPDYRSYLFRTLGSEKLSYDEIGETFGGDVSRERIRGLYEKLRPLEYAEEKVERVS